jgi:hypothetical protein
LYQRQCKSDLGKSGSALASDVRSFKQFDLRCLKMVIMFQLFEVNIELRIAVLLLLITSTLHSLNSNYSSLSCEDTNVYLTCLASSDLRLSFSLVKHGPQSLEVESRCIMTFA